MTSEVFRSTFEALVPEVLQCAFEYVDFDDRVETMWIVGHRDGDWATGHVVYRAAGAIVRPGRMAATLPGFDDSVEHQRELYPAIDPVTDLLLSVGDREENPTRIVIRYDVSAQAMNADFYYEPLRRGPDDTLSEVSEAWFERLQQTGNDSAAD